MTNMTFEEAILGNRFTATSFFETSKMVNDEMRKLEKKSKSEGDFISKKVNLLAHHVHYNEFSHYGRNDSIIRKIKSMFSA